MAYPFESGVYSVAPGLRLLATPATSVECLSRYRMEKAAAAAHRRVCLSHEFGDETRRAAYQYLAGLLQREHPEVYGGPLPGTLDELPMLMTEDVAVMQVDGEREWLAFGHVCLPSSWRLEDKIGRPFLEVHRPVPGFPEKGAAGIVRSLTDKGPYERFAWGLTNTDRLDQTAPSHVDVEPAPLYIRVERQTIHPLRECSAWLFLIHPANTPIEGLTGYQRQKLAEAIQSMTQEQAVYKGLGETRTAVIAAILKGTKG